MAICSAKERPVPGNYTQMMVTFRTGNGLNRGWRYLRPVAYAWIALMTVFSLQPFRFGATRQGTHSHVPAHIAAFGGAAILFLISSKSRAEEWFCAASLISLAVAIEVAQWLIYKGVFEWWDIRTDAAAIVAAALLIQGLGARRFGEASR